MHHDIPLISTMAMAFVVACVFGFAAHRLRLPALVGYLIAGVVIGPFSPGGWQASWPRWASSC